MDPTVSRDHLAHKRSFQLCSCHTIFFIALSPAFKYDNSWPRSIALSVMIKKVEIIKVFVVCSKIC